MLEEERRRGLDGFRARERGRVVIAVARSVMIVISLSMPIVSPAIIAPPPPEQADADHDLDNPPSLTSAHPRNLRLTAETELRSNETRHL